MIKNDIDENTIEEIYPGVIDILLVDRTTRKNIIFASENYKKHGFGPGEKDFIKKDMILRKRLRVFLNKYYKEYQTNEGYVLKCDITKYFPNINHIALK